MMTGEQDHLLASNLQLMDDLGSQTKAFITIESATHFAVWERQRRVLHDASLQWLTGRTIGEGGQIFRAGPDSVVRPA